ncbi:MAG: amidophosphoribosyltransferase [Armatimonadetes bacterium]|nr:amidophosphoribosyltransferase [Armatimonadota bacterium]MDE2206379.1 amidophosphoribosyltransferase [Armatimonadota bacterium]
MCGGTLVSDRPHEECGVFGIRAPGEDVARIAFFGIFALQHRGQESAGIAVSAGRTIAVHKAMGLVTQVFDERTIGSLKGDAAIGHTRYSTTGSSDLCNAQPVVCHTDYGDIALAHNGNLINSAELKSQLTTAGVQFTSTNDSEVIAQLLACLHKGDIAETVREAMPRLQGAYSLTVLAGDTLVGVRDPYGVRPLCLGQISGVPCVIASETCALKPTGATYMREVQPGEIYVIGPGEASNTLPPDPAHHATCLFEFIYFARPDSKIYDKRLQLVRKRMGSALAQQHPAPRENAIVIPVPDTSIPAALGYAESSGIPYSEGIIKNRYIQRTFIQPSPYMRDQGAMMKYTPIPEVIEGKSIVMVDDSIVRGTTTGKLVKLLFETGAKEVHVRITAPPVRFPCYYGIDMANQDELIAARNTVEEIRQAIGATSLGYLSLQGAVDAVGLNRDKFCRACFDGKYPLAIPQDIKLSKMMLTPPPASDEDVDEDAETPAHAAV